MICVCKCIAILIKKSENHQSNMLNLLILHMTFLIQIFSGSYITYNQNYKSFGMQTLYDYILNNIIIEIANSDTIICFSSMTLQYTAATFFNNPTIAKLILASVMVCTVHNAISLLSVAGTSWSSMAQSSMLRKTMRF